MFIIIGVILLVLFVLGVIIFGIVKNNDKDNNPKYSDKCVYAYDRVINETGNYSCNILDEDLEEIKINCQFKENTSSLDYGKI